MLKVMIKVYYHAVITVTISFCSLSLSWGDVRGKLARF